MKLWSFAAGAVWAWMAFLSLLAFAGKARLHRLIEALSPGASPWPPFLLAWCFLGALWLLREQGKR